MTGFEGPERISPPVSRRKAAAAQRRTSSPSRRLTVDDWTDAALAVLLRDGVAAVSIKRVCAELDITKGSFYWHFDDLDQLLTATADRWCAAHNDAVRGLSGLEAQPPAQRLQRMGELLIDKRVWRIEQGIRDWARTNSTIAAAVRDLDRRIMQTLESTLVELGLDADQARLRAGLLVFAGIGFVHGNHHLPAPTDEQMRAVFELITGR